MVVWLNFYKVMLGLEYKIRHSCTWPSVLFVYPIACSKVFFPKCVMESSFSKNVFYPCYCVVLHLQMQFNYMMGILILLHLNRTNTSQTLSSSQKFFLLICFHLLSSHIHSVITLLLHHSLANSICRLLITTIT